MDNNAFTDPTDLAIFAIAAVALVTAALTSSGRLTTALARHILRPVIQAPDTDLVAAAAKWWRRRLIGTACGMVIGAVALTFAVWALGADRNESGAPDWIILGGVAGGVFGAGVHRAFISRPSTRTTNVAHSRMLRLVDFTPRWLRHGIRIAVLLAVLMAVAVVLGILLSPKYDISFLMPQMLMTPPFLLTVLGVLALIRFELSGRLIVQRSTSARSEHDLAIDTILRCLAVRDLAQAAVLVGVLGSLLFIPELIHIWELTLLGPHTLAIAEVFNMAVVILACVGAAIAIFGPARIRPPIRLPRQPLVQADVSS